MISPTLAPPVTTEVCISPAHANPEPPTPPPSTDCRVLPVQANANEMAYTVNCEKTKRSASVKMTYFGDRYEGTGTIMDFVEIQTKYTGRRIGPCNPNANSAGAAENTK